MEKTISRRTGLKGLSSTAVFFGLTGLSYGAENDSSNRKGRIHHSVSKWCYAGQELVPFHGNPLKSLRQTIEICDV